MEFGFASNACNFIFQFCIERPVISFLNHVEDISSHGATYDNAGILISIEKVMVKSLQCVHTVNSF